MISPSAMLEIIERIEKALWEKFETKKYQNVKRYISRWHVVYDEFGNSNFDTILQKDNDNIDLPATLVAGLRRNHRPVGIGILT